MKYLCFLFVVICLIPELIFARFIEDLFGTTFEYKFVGEAGSVIEPQQRIYYNEGTIPHLQRDTVIKIPDFPNTGIALVKVTVKALTPPKVDYDSEWRTITIRYNLLQSTASSYTVEVSGVQQQQQLIQYELANIQTPTVNEVTNRKVKTKVLKTTTDSN